jgi:hypothetical protein
MNQKAEDAITGMLNCFPQTGQDYQILLGTLENLLHGMDDLAVIAAAERFASGNVPEQSKKFAPSGPEFMDEVRRQQEYISLRNRPRIAAPVYRPGPLAPFQIAQQKKFAENSHLPVLFENINFDTWKRMSKEKQVPVGAKWVASMGIVYGPEPKQQTAAA